MSIAFWLAAKRGGRGLDGRGTDSWTRCKTGECLGRALPTSLDPEDKPRSCFAHLPRDQRADAVTVMSVNERVDVRGTTLNERDVEELLHGVLAGRFDFRSCNFTGAAPFNGTLLRLRKQFSDRTKAGVVDFGKARFDAGANFTKVEFPGPVFFDNTTLAGPLVLDRAVFSDEAWFLHTTMYDAQVTGTTFDGFAGFHDVRASTTLNFTGATFSGRTDFDNIHAATIDFTEATFSKHTSMLLFGPEPLDPFRGDDGRFPFPWTSHPLATCLLASAHFDQGLELRLDGEASVMLDGTRLGASSTITSHRTAPPGEKTSAFDDFRSLAQVRSLQDTDVEKLSLVSVDLSECLFAGALNLDKLRLSGTIRFACLPGARSRREVIFEERTWRWLHARRGLFGRSTVRWPENIGGEPGRYSVTGDHLASLYRSLRKAREDAKDEPGAGDFYYGEMEARRLTAQVGSSDYWLLTLYWALSGYGQRASRALVALAVLLGGLTVLLTGYGLGDTAPVQRITDAARTTAPPSSQVITVDLAGQRATVTVPPPATPPVELDVRTVAPQLPPADQRWTAARVQRAIGTLVTSLVPITTDQRLTTLGGYLVLLGRVLGAILLGLAVLAIRARVKR